MQNHHVRRAVLLNDTSFAPHHGSRHVVAAIRAGLAKRGIEIAASAPAGAYWDKDQAFLSALATADLIVINGEGTLHHGAPAGERLLRIVEHPLRKGRPVALLNALWQDNPASWNPLLAQIDLISVRDSRSQGALAKAGFEVEMCPDFSFYQSWPDRSGEDPARVVFGDCVSRDTSRALLDAYRNHKRPKLYLSIRARLKHMHGPLSIKRRLNNAKYRARARLQAFTDRNRMMALDAAEYVALLARCGLHITGRFHGACLSVAVGLPFIAVTSNSHKIEALIEDIGLDARRVAATVEDAMRAGPRDYSADEKANIQKWLALARQKADGLFDGVASLRATGGTSTAASGRSEA